MTITLMQYVILLLSLVCVVSMVIQLVRQKNTPLSPWDYVKLVISGIVAFVADAFGVGSFAVNVALSKLFGTFDDEQLPAVSNGAQVIPGAMESLYFMQLIDVDLTTLLTLVVGACLGGVIGGTIASRLSRQVIRLAMMACFSLIIFLLMAHQFHLVPPNGELIVLSGWRLVFGFIGMAVCGALTSFGVGLFVMVQALLFVLDVSPLLSFPIMTTAGAMQQPLTTLVFLQQGKIPLKKTLILSLSGCIGVYLAMQLFVNLTVTWLHTLLLGIVIYNLISMTRDWFRARPKIVMQERVSA